MKEGWLSFCLVSWLINHYFFLEYYVIWGYLFLGRCFLLCWLVVLLFFRNLLLGILWVLLKPGLEEDDVWVSFQDCIFLCWFDTVWGCYPLLNENGFMFCVSCLLQFWCLWFLVVTAILLSLFLFLNSTYSFLEDGWISLNVKSEIGKFKSLNSLDVQNYNFSWSVLQSENLRVNLRTVLEKCLFWTLDLWCVLLFAILNYLQYQFMKKNFPFKFGFLVFNFDSERMKLYHWCWFF